MMDTIVYVDGYNFYFSLLKHTRYKWLDLYTLFSSHILLSQNAASNLLCVKYYTADIKAKFSPRGASANEAQRRYHRALASPHTGTVSIVKGSYSVERVNSIRYQEPPDLTDKVAVWRLEEKQSDVNIALDIYRDVSQSKCAQVVLCSNDTDLVSALKYVNSDFPAIKIGVVFPRMAYAKRPPPKSLLDYADWSRKHITEQELKLSQFQHRVPTAKRPVYKPSNW